MKRSGISLMVAMALLGNTSVRAAQEAEFTREDVAKHASKDDCWIIIDNVVYDITEAVQDHLRYKYAVDPWCGKESTEAWNTKDGKNKAHSRKAQLMLKELRKGKIKGT
jgi:cytochrome b involved in lipid metabolism